MIVSIEIRGLDMFARKFRDFPMNFRTEFTDAIKKVLFVIEAEAKQVTPVRTGHLMGSIGTPPYGFKKVSELYGAVGTNVEYAIYVHEGTRYMKARPFMMWGIRNAEDDINDIFIRALDNVLNK